MLYKRKSRRDLRFFKDMVKKTIRFSKRKIGKLLIKFSLLCVISMLVASLYNIVDQIFIANASYLGSYGNAANTVVFR